MSAPAATAGHKRKRIWLVNRRFQLKYTFMIVGVVLAVAGSLALVVGSLVQTALEHAQTAELFAAKAQEESEANSKLARHNAAALAGDNTFLLQELEKEISAASAQSAEEVAHVQKAADDLQRSAKRLAISMVVGLLLLGGALTMIGLRITQRIVGPVHRIKRLLRRVGTGRLTTNERLRRGDELEDLFETFLQMTYSLLALQRGRLATLEATLRDARRTNADESVFEGLNTLRAQLELGLGVEAAIKRRASTLDPLEVNNGGGV